MERTILFALAAALSLAVASIGLAKDSAPDQIKVEICGTLKSGIVAIGGETTGVTITAGKTTWELDLGDNAELKKKAEALNGHKVDVAGIYLPREGVEVKVRHIVKVTSLKEATEK